MVPKRGLFGYRRDRVCELSGECRSKGVKFWHRVASRGNAAAHKNLGVIFGEGTVVAKNVEAAPFHHAKALQLSPENEEYQMSLKTIQVKISSVSSRNEIKKTAEETDGQTLAEDKGLAKPYFRK